MAPRCCRLQTRPAVDCARKVCTRLHNLNTGQEGYARSNQRGALASEKGPASLNP
jgi:hypothetical protein